MNTTIDTDFEALGREDAIELVVRKYGRENVANIITHGTFKPKSLTRRYFKITEGDSKLMYEILDKIPPPLFGKEATLKEIIEGNPEKGYPPHPELRKDPKYTGWLLFTEQLENMISNFGIHAAGIVISDFPISDVVPIWKNSKADRITQWDMDEVQENGIIKFDFLSINNLDIIKECFRLVEERHGVSLNPWTLPDHDEPTYQLLQEGYLAGIFQMETSNSARDLIMRIKPRTIDELSDISALNRPGCLSNGFHEIYISNKQAGSAPPNMQPCLVPITANSWWTIIYQETVMQITVDIGGFTLLEADSARRTLGKKDITKLLPYKEKFLTGAMRYMSRGEGEKLWDELAEFANYSFNKSHSVN